jgi:uncharacterized protein (DUF169 family)
MEKNPRFHLQELLELRVQPVAVAFRSAPPPGVKKVAAQAPAGCGYWKLAAQGETFFTEASDHYNCPVGAHTHGIDLPPEKAKELEGLVGTMVGLRYIKMEEVAAIPQLAPPFDVAVYAPLQSAPCDPDVVLVRGNARQMMLIAEAARLAGAGHDGPTMGRPACAVIPEAIRSGRATTSLGCIGNRVYTGLADDEFYFAIPGGKIDAILDALGTIVNANNELERFHQGRAGAG